MKKILPILAALLLLTACAPAEEKEREAVYRNITPEEAKTVMDTQSGYIILDVREQSEYDESHIPNALLLPLGEVETRAKDVLPDQDQLLLVYCRSGRRSRMAAEILVNLGYTNIMEFGGILDWPYEVE